MRMRPGIVMPGVTATERLAISRSTSIGTCALLIADKNEAGSGVGAAPRAPGATVGSGCV
jgi:hypothetical protein